MKVTLNVADSPCQAADFLAKAANAASQDIENLLKRQSVIYTANPAYHSTLVGLDLITAAVHKYRSQNKSIDPNQILQEVVRQPSWSHGMLDKQACPHNNPDETNSVNYGKDQVPVSVHLGYPVPSCLC